VWNGFWWTNGVGWESSRVIVDTGQSLDGETIQEFPAFSFILGDLHPHVLALPFTIVVLGLAVSLFKRVHNGWDPSDWREWIEFIAVGAVLGALYPMNSWDFPTYGVAIAIALLISTGPNRVWVQQMVAIGFFAILAWSPFWVSFVPFAGPGVETSNIPGISFIQKNVAAYTGERSSAGEYLTVWGLLWVVSLLVLFVETISTWPERDPEQESTPQPPYIRGAIIAGVIAFAMIAFALPAPVLVLAGIPIALAGRLIWLRWDEPRDLTTLVCVLLAAGWAITITTEFFYIRDVFNGRFNTLFKIYYQVWTILGIGCALGLALLWSRTRQRGHQMLLATGMTVALLAGIAYPMISIKTWFDYLNPDREWAGLDGMAGHGTIAFMPDPANTDFNTGESIDDIAAVRWLNEHAEDGDVLLEAPGCGYQLNGALPTSRFSAFTGIPTVIGWDNSENQWRGGQPELLDSVPVRSTDVAAMFEDPNPTTNPLFDQYGITLLVVGDFEKYGAGGNEERRNCAKAGPFQSVFVDGYPGEGWELVYDASATRIYRRI
jgi:YYY domain-containing protein